MHLPRFEYIEPKTVKEACAALSEFKGEARVLAGGSDLLVMMKQKVVTPRCVVNIKRIAGLGEIKEGARGLRIGALATLSRIASSSVIQRRFPLLSEAAGSVATQQIQATATLGGNICLDAKCWYYNQSHVWRKSREVCIKRGGTVCHVVKGGRRCYAVVSGDTIPVLVALGGKVKVVGSGGQRVVALEEFYTGVGETPNVLKPDEIVTEIQVPYLPEGGRGSFVKHSMRRAIDFGVADVAAVVVKEGKVCKEARLVMSSVGPAVTRLREAEALLKGKEISESLLEEVGKAVVKDVHLVSGAMTSVYYRRKVMQVISRQAVREAMGLG